MQETLKRIGFWILRRFLIGLVLLVLWALLLGAGLYFSESRGDDTETTEELRLYSLAERLDTLHRDFLGNQADMETFVKEITTARSELADAEKAIEGLRGKQGFWKRWFSGRDEREFIDASLLIAEDSAKNARNQIQQLERKIEQNNWEAEGLMWNLERVEREIAQIEQEQGEGEFYTREAWARIRGYWWLPFAVAFFGDSLMRVFLYFAWAKWVARGQGIRFLHKEPDVLPRSGTCEETLSVSIWPGDQLRAPRKYVKTWDSSLVEGRRLIISRRFPFFSLSAGLTNVVELKNVQAGESDEVVFEDGNNHFIEVGVDAGASVILRMGFLAGIIHHVDRSPEIVGRWRFFDWQSWVSFQFRYLEFRGACRLILKSRQMMRVQEAIATDRKVLGTRVKMGDAIAFTPNLCCRPVRSGTFWSYFKGMAPLFDELFEGDGVVLLCEEQGVVPKRKKRDFLKRAWRRLLRIWGI